MLSVMGIEWSDVKASQRRVTSEGYEIDFERNVDDADYVYRIHVSRNDSAGYMLASWVRRGEDTAMLDDVLSRFELAPAPPFGGDSPHQGSLLNEMGLTYYQRAQYAQSAPFFEAASRTSPTDPVPAGESGFGARGNGALRRRIEAARRMRWPFPRHGLTPLLSPVFPRQARPLRRGGGRVSRALCERL